jgi:pyruvate dehydrogenase E2 component (dihydrolipoyllysine-residue acetyltransferase)
MPITALTAIVVLLVIFIINEAHAVVRVVAAVLLVLAIGDLLRAIHHRHTRERAPVERRPVPAPPEPARTTGSELDNVQVLMPSLGKGVESGLIVRWVSAVGDRVDPGQPLAEIASEKVETELPSPTAGILESILVPAGGTVAPGAPVAVIVPTSFP